MKRNRGPLVLFKRLAPLMLGRLATAAEQVPYTEGLTEGQGFNTYLQTGCLHNAVDIAAQYDAAANPSADQAEVAYSARRVADYKDLVQSLDVSAGATMAKLGTAASTSARFLDRDEFDSSFLTYLVKVDVRRQPSSRLSYRFNRNDVEDRQRTYGDRFISDFVRGGALFARVSITTKDGTRHREVEQCAAVAFTVFGADAKATASIRSSIDTIRRHSEMRIYLHYVGAPPEYMYPAETESRGANDNELLQLKDAADRFLSEAQRHEWKRFAILERYPNAPGFADYFKPLDYSEATDRSWTFLNDFSSYLGIQSIIRQIAPWRYVGAREKRDELDGQSSDVLAGYRDWVANVSAHPEMARQRPPYEDPSVFRGQVLLAVRTVPYIAQRLTLEGGGSTDLIDKTLHPGATKLLDVEAYDLEGVPGTINVVFAKKWDEDKYICMRKRPVPPGYQVVSQLWVFGDAFAVQGVVNGSIEVVAKPRPASIELRPSLGVPNGLGRRATRLREGPELRLFRFYVKTG